MLFSWLRSRRRRRIAAAPFPEAWEGFLVAGVRQTAWLSADEGQRLRATVKVLLAEKRFEGCGGLALDDEIRVVTAGQLALAALGLSVELFERLGSVLLYPGDFRAPRAEALGGGVDIEWREPLEGAVSTDGAMVLSWPWVRAGGRLRDGARSLVIHETAHLLDGRDGALDGVVAALGPRGADDLAASRHRFAEVLDEGRHTPFDDYADTSPVEFFAVASECFFQDPHPLWRYDRRLYERLAEAWRQDPRSRVPVGGTRRG